MTNTLVLLKQFGLSKGSINYSEKANAFLSSGYTSSAGNTYLNAVRFAEGIVIKEDIGIGHTYVFLNGLRIYSLKNNEMLADRNYHNFCHSKFNVKSESVKMLMEVLQNAAKKEGYKIDEKQAKSEIGKIIDMAMNENQVELMQRQSQKYLRE